MKTFSVMSRLAALGLVLVAATGCDRVARLREPGPPAAGASAPAASAGHAAEREAPGVPIASIDLPIETEVASERPLAIEASALAVIATLPDRRADLGFKSSGRIEHLSVTEGSHVRRGQTLGRLAERGQANSQAAVAEANLQQDRDLYAHGIIARRQLEASQLQAQEARLGSTNTEVIAPFAGTIVKRMRGDGEVVDATTPVLTLLDLSVVDATASVYESDLARFQVGAVATFGSPAYPGRRFKGRVALVSDLLDPTSHTLQVKVRVPNADRALKVGMSGRVSLRTGTRRGLAVPASCVLDAPGGGKQVFVREGDRYELRPVKLGLVDGDRAELTSGVKAGEAVVVSGQFELQASLNKGAVAADND